MLPKIEQPIYTATILSQPKPVEFNIFTVRESKILMMAKEGKELSGMVDALRQILANCLVDKTINVAQLPMVDLEWLFLNIQARSFGEKTPLYFKCNNLVKTDDQVEKHECGMVIELEVDLLKVPIVGANVETKIMLTEHDGLQMRFPNFETTQQLLKTSDDMQDVVLAAGCVDYVFDATAVYYPKDMLPGELQDFIEALPITKYMMIEQFLANCPTIRETVSKDCPKCGFHHVITLEGLEDFFT
ncbi:MAG: hypothetical protein ACREQ5_08360 [Candidatus Dormibacteria bacterium]